MINQVINKISNIQNFNELWLHDFEKLKSYIYDYFHDIEEWLSQDIENEIIWIEIFESAYLKNDCEVIIHAYPNYYRQVAFSDICIKMDELK